ncbi:hypothetical protein ACFOON_11095 [Novosphingobium piscinae]|uniref:Uncharacterized protein n=1 Tax=Novosphingobium piscinae TaxID=1507448 RepID=A0A7X1KPC4_9SPHN|nr:hypothetical protein [Novosphingobium piscinae]MBC2668235.1 hypothetical protein [Novosphingobium piscinae]
MPLTLMAPFDQTDTPDTALPVPAPAKARHRTLRSALADGCYIALRSATFVASSYLMVLGLPLVFALALSGGNPDALFAHLANLAERFLAADLTRRAGFLGEVKLTGLGLATLVVAWRLPRFIRDVERELSGDKA